MLPNFVYQLVRSFKESFICPKAPIIEEKPVKPVSIEPHVNKYSDLSIKDRKQIIHLYQDGTPLYIIAKNMNRPKALIYGVVREYKAQRKKANDAK